MSVKEPKRTDKRSSSYIWLSVLRSLTSVCRSAWVPVSAAQTFCCKKEEVELNVHWSECHASDWCFVFSTCKWTAFQTRHSNVDPLQQSLHRQTGRGNTACFRVCSEREMATWLCWKVCVYYFPSLHSCLDWGSVSCIWAETDLTGTEEMGKKGYLRHVTKYRRTDVCVRERCA